MLVGVMVDSVHHAVEVFLEGLDIVKLNRHSAAKSGGSVARPGEQPSTQLVCDVCRDRPAVTTRHVLVVFVCGACVGIKVERSESGFSPVLIAGRNRACGIDRTQVVRA